MPKISEENPDNLMILTEAVLCKPKLVINGVPFVVTTPSDKILASLCEASKEDTRKKYEAGQRIGEQEYQKCMEKIKSDLNKTCRVCLLVCRSAVERKEHEKYDHDGKVRPKVFYKTCDLCGLECTSGKKMLKHRKAVHGQTLRLVEEARIRKIAKLEGNRGFEAVQDQCSYT